MTFFIIFLFGTIAIVISAIGAFYVTISMSLAAAFVLEKESSPWRAIAASFQATRWNFWRLLALYILQSFIILLGIIPFFIGLIWAIPFSFILYGMIYQRLSINTRIDFGKNIS